MTGVHHRTRLFRAWVFSMGIHAIVLLGIVGSRNTYTVPPMSTGGELVLASEEALVEASIEVSESDFVQALADPVAAEPPVAPAEPDLTLRPDDDATRSASPQAPRFGLLREAQAPAPDSGKTSGQALPAAWRRDRSTLRERLTDGANVYQPSRERTSSRMTSPQALRRESVVGIGDSSRTQKPRPAEEQVPTPELPSQPEQERDQTRSLASQARPVPAVNSDAIAKGEGPLDATRGKKSFDLESPGIARDAQSLRAASNEPRPGLLDLAKAAAPGPENGAGRGPAPNPGAVSRPASGAAAAQAGSPEPVALGDQVALNAAERQYQRYELEIRRRVGQALRFPKKLGLMLEQGETILKFMVGPDGRLASTVVVVKSAGFTEFDEEAVSAVNRAAPFPALGRPLPVSMTVHFQNPVIR